MEYKRALAEARNKGSTKDERKPYLIEFSNIKFPAQPAEYFRALLTSASNGVVIWLESKKTKQQWQETVTDLSVCGQLVYLKMPSLLS
ncbi:hypothetical protein EON65_32855 [archaeon]|nr:MAG: hypothetical protein EON65_32855 [archaeon]